MSPVQNPSGRPSPYILSSQVASSNSTANQFLGASQKSWMTNTASPLSLRSEPRKAPSSISRLLVDASASGNPKQAFPRRENTVSSNPNAARPSPSQLSTRHRMDGLQSPSVRAPQDTAARPVQAAPVSPLTPGARHSESEFDHFPADRRMSQATNVPRLDCAASNTTLPTPEPSNASHTSPAGVAEGVELPGTYNFQLMPPMTEAQPAGAINGEGAITSPPTMGSFGPSVSLQSQSQQATSQTIQPSLPRIQTVTRTLPDRHWVWQRAKETLRSFLAMSTKYRTLSETVELPRVRILQDACASEDMFYLALHQTFCLSSFAPTQLRQVLQFGIRPDLGFDVIAQLLVDNKRLSAEFVKWSVSYPSPFDSMLELQEYKDALLQVSHCLHMISENWSTFERDLRARGHPPQVDELVVRLGVVSPVFQTIVFTAVSRRLLGPREEVFKACMSLFEEDQKTYKQRCASSAALRREAMFAYFEKYRQLCASQGVLRQTPAVNGHRDKRTSTANAASPGQPSTTMSQNTSTGLTFQEKIMHTASANNPQRPPMNTHLNLRPGANYPPSSNPMPNQHISPDVTSSIVPPQRQLPPYQSPMGLPQRSQHAQPNKHYLPTSQTTVSLPSRPPPSPHHIMNVQGNAPISGPPTHMPPLHPQSHQYLPQHMKLGSNGRSPSTSSQTQSYSPVGNVNMAPCLYSPHSARSPYSMGHPSPSVGQGQRPTFSQNLPQSRSVSFTTPKLASPSSPSYPVPSLPPPSSIQQKGASFTFAPHFSPKSFSQAMPHPTPPLPTQSSSITESPEVIQYFSDFSIPPQRLPHNRSVFAWKFSVSREHLRLRPRLIMQPNGRGYAPVLSDGDVSYRLRCIRYDGHLDLGSVAAWSQAENHWPDVVYIHVNNTEIHRSTHAKNLPLSINSYLKEGANEVRLNVLHNSKHRTKDTVYAVAIEILHVRSPINFKSLVKALPAHESRRQIQDRLSINSNDDDLMIMDDFITIDLRDPFTTRIFEVPVRGLLCTHRECFDLSTFLQTLTVKPSTGKRTLYVRCPICRKDARPNLLIVDDFLIDVRSALSQQNQLETAKAIRVKSDGSWEVVLDVDTDVRTSSRKRDRASFEADLIKTEEIARVTPPRATAAPEVIELD